MHHTQFVLHSAAGDVVAAHVDFIMAGATVIETWNYSVTPYWLRNHHTSNMQAADTAKIMETFEDLTRKSVRLAKQARELCGTPHVRIAGTLPPIAETFSATEPIMDSFIGEPVDTRAFYLTLARILAEEGVDLFLIETCASTSFASAAVQACREADADKELWMAFTLRHTAPVLCSGESVRNAIQVLSSLPCRKIDALLFNCCPTEIIYQAIEIARPLFDGKLGGYGNRRSERKMYGVKEANAQLQAGPVHLNGERAELIPDAYTQWAEDCISKGATIIGGCCQVGPQHIESLARMVERRTDRPEQHQLAAAAAAVTALLPGSDWFPRPINAPAILSKL